jgi:hypothetical protein
VTWRRYRAALVLAAALAVIYAQGALVDASAGQSGVLGRLSTDQSRLQSLIVQVDRMGFLDGNRAPILADLSSASASLLSLRTRTLTDTSPQALGADAALLSSLEAALGGLEEPKVRLVGRVDHELDEHSVLLRAIELSGGLALSSSAHAQAEALVASLRRVRADLDQALTLLDQATLSSYPGSHELLAPARSLIDRSQATLALVDRLAVQLPLQGALRTENQLRVWIMTTSLALDQARARVTSDLNLTVGERANLMSQLNADLAAFGQLSKLVGTGGNLTVAGALSYLMNQPGTFILIIPKSDIMLAAAADRAAIQRLNVLVPTLQARIADLAASGKQVSGLRLLLSDLSAQVAGAGAELAPVDSEFETMIATTATQLDHDTQVIRITTVALEDASTRLTAASRDANEILLATA